MLITFLLLVIPIMTSGLFSLYSLNKYFTLPHFSTASIIILLILIPLVILISTWLTASRYVQFKSVIENSKSSMKDLLKQGWGLLGKFFITSFLAGVVVVLGFMLLLIPGIIFAVWFSFVLGVLIFEGKSGTAAMSRSRELTKGRFWQVAWYIAFPALIVIVMQALGGLVAATTTKQVAEIFNTLFSILFIPAGTIIGIYSLLVYKAFASAKA